jgi:hypothetical protein
MSGSKDLKGGHSYTGKERFTTLVNLAPLFGFTTALKSNPNRNCVCFIVYIANMFMRQLSISKPITNSEIQ